MNFVTTIRRQLHRRNLVSALRHMRALHPDFHLEEHPGAPGAADLLWKRRRVGQTRPLSELPRPAAADCFLVATGPSLTAIDFRRLRDRVCIGVNGSIVRSDETGVPLAVYVVTDGNFVLDRFPLVRQAIMSGADCLFSFRALGRIVEREPALASRDNLFLLSEMNLRYGVRRMTPAAFDAWAEADADLVLHPTARLRRGRVGFSRRMAKGVFTGQTVTFAALQVAYSLGFRRVFILGMDLGGGQRFYESGRTAASTRLDRDFELYIRPAFEVARSITEAEAFAIHNLAANSRLPSETIPKLSFDAALA